MLPAHELESELRYRRIARRLKAAGADSALLKEATAAARDEARHAAQCATLAHQLGDVMVAVPAAALPEVAPVGLSDEARVLYESVAFGCLAETLNVALLIDELRDLHDPRTKQVMRSILRDEVRHARFGWKHLRVMAERGLGHPGQRRNSGPPYQRCVTSAASVPLAAHTMILCRAEVDRGHG